MYNLLFISYIVLLSADFIMLMYSLGRRGTYAENGMSLSLMANAFIQAGLLIGLATDVHGALRIAVSITMAGLLYIVVYAYVYLRQFVGDPMMALRSGIVQGIPIFFVIFQWVPIGGRYLVYKNIEYISYEDHVFCRTPLSVFGWIYAVGVIGVFYILSIRLMVRAIIKSQNEKWKNAVEFMLALYILPGVITALCAIGIFNPATNPVYIVIGIICVIWSVYVTIVSKYNLSIEGEHIIFQKMDMAAIVMDENRKFIRANDMGYKIFPSLEGMEGFDLRALFEFDIDDFGEGQTEEFEYGGQYYRAGITTITDNSGTIKGYILSLINITETFNFIGEIMELRDEADKANRAKSNFLANMSHEIRTPMNAIVGMSELIIEEARDEKEIEYARDIKTASQNLLSIINDILDISKVESGSMEMANDPYLIEDLVADVYNIVKIPATDKGLEIITEVEPDTPAEFYGDMGRIRQIIINLFNNAIKFTREGSVSLHVSARRFENEVYNVFIRVEDTGIGISSGDMEKLFERFGRVESKEVRRIEGSGLGLVIAKNFVEMMNGTIDVESEVGKGSVFTVTIRQICKDPMPVSGRRFGDDEADDIDGTREMFESPGYKLLLVDDNRVNLKVASGLLSPYKFDIDQVTSGIDAIEKEEQNDYDMILMDHMMPEMDGIEATRHILDSCQATGKNPVMIALTANSFRGAKEMFQSNGFSDYLSKPIDKNDLHKLLCKWVPRDLRKPVTSQQEKAGKTTAVDAAAIRMQGVDTQAALERQSGGVSAYLELLELFYMDGREKKELIFGLRESGDLKNYDIEVHALKSAAANIGAMHLSEFAKAHEAAAKTGDKVYIEKECDALITEYGQILDEIERVLKNNGKLREDSGEKTRSFSPEEVKEQLELILELSEGFKSKEAQEKLDELFQGSIDPTLEVRLHIVKNKFRMYDDDGAEDLLKEILESL